VQSFEAKGLFQPFTLRDDQQFHGVRLLRFDLEPPLEQVADQPMAAIEALRIDAIQLTPSSRQIGIRRFRHEVVMDSSFRNTHGNAG
jgi:hypothetical protein